MDAPGSGPPPLAPPPAPPPAPLPAPRPRSPLRLALGVAMALAGLVWIGQGTGVLSAGTSFMIGDPTWTVIGAGFLVTGVILSAREVRRR